MMNVVLAQTLRWQRITVAVATAGSALVFYKSKGDIYGVPKATVVALAAVACLAIAAGRAIREREVVLPGLWCAAAAGAFVVALGITTITSTTPLQSLVGEFSQYAGFLGYLGGVILFFTVVRAFDERSLPVLVLTIVGSAAAITVYGLLQWADIDPWHLRSAHNIISTMGNTNFLGGWLGMAFPLCAVVALAPLPVAWRVVGGATAIGIVPLALATESFQGPATVAVAALVLVVLLLVTGAVPVPTALRGRRGIAVVVVLVVLAAPVAVKVLGDGIDQGLLERRYFWQVAVEVFE
ncbi:MAG: O-antigen ligase protein, partial [Actinomycetia bacterium]|nr:O-antigen ligase protein [Actinomycetes bacterium]